MREGDKNSRRNLKEKSLWKLSLEWPSGNWEDKIKMLAGLH